MIKKVIESRGSAFKENFTAQRRYFLDKINAEKENAITEPIEIVRGQTIREEFIERTNLIRSSVQSGVLQHPTQMLMAQNRNDNKLSTLPKPKGYTRQVNAGGHLVLYKDGELCHIISNYVPKLEEILVDEDENRIYRIQVFPAKPLPESQREPFFIDIPEGLDFAEEIQRRRKSLSLECNFSRANSNLNAFVMDQVAFCEEKLIYTKPGIVRTNKGYDFVDKNGSLMGSDLRVNMEQKLEYDFRWPEKYIADSIVNLLRMSDKLEKILPVVLFSVLARISVLYEMANCLPKSYLQLCGRTGSLKTSMALAVLVPHRNADGDLPPGTFEHTAAALEIEASRHRSSVFLIDDIHPCSNHTIAQKINKSYETMVRMYGDGSSNVRANGSMKKQKTYKASGLCAFTAEYPLGSESDRARGLIIDVDQATYRRDILSFYQQNPTIVPTFLAYFLRYVLPKAEQFIEYISRQFLNERLAYLGVFEHGRQTENYACLKVVANILLQYLASQGSIADMAETEKKWDEALYKAVEAGQTEIKNHNPVSVFVKTLHMMVATNRIPFIPYELRMENSEKIVAGFFDDEYYYLHFEMVFNLVSKEASNLGSRINMNKRQLMVALAAEGLLETFTETRDGKNYELRTKKISVSVADRAQMALMKRKVLNQKLEEIRYDE